MKRFLAGALAGVTALTLTVGCANRMQQLEPKLELKKAAEALGATGGAGFTIKAGGSVDDLIALAKKDSGDKFYESKLATARFYFARLYPETAMLIRQARSGSANLLAMDADLF